MSDDAPPSGPESSITPDKLRGRLAEELREALARGESPSLREYSRKYGLSVAEVGRILEGLRAMAAVAGDGARAAPFGPPPLPEDYEVLGELGRGAMGVVYRARQRSLGRVVAVKVLRPGDVLFVNLADRFRREVQALAKLRHPHIVAVHEVGEAGGHLFFSMDLVEGRSLHELVAAGEMTPTRSVKLLAQVASAIAYTHSHGLVHRDLKPGNILVDGKDDAYVVDFGLARDTAIDGQLTGTGQILGTPAYMSPEQARGDAAQIGEASDVYSMGAVLYECLTRRAPFEGRSLVETIRAVAQDEPALPRKVDPRIPRDLEVVCLTAMAKEPQRRYPSAQAFQEDLERFVEGLPIRARPASAAERLRRWGQRNPVVLTSLAAVLVVLVGALWVTVHFLKETVRERNEKSAALVDARRERDAKLDLLRRERAARLVAQSDSQLRVDPALALRLAIEASRVERSADADDALRRGLAAYHPARVIEFRHREVVLFALSLDGRTVFTSAGNQGTIQRWNLQSGSLLCEWRPSIVDGRHAIEQMGVLPGPERLVLVGEGRAVVVDGETGRELTRLEGEPRDLVPGPSPDGSRVATSDGLWDTRTGRRLVAAEEGAAFVSAFSPDGSRLLVWDGTSYRVLDTSDGRVLSSRTADDDVLGLVWRPSGPLAFDAGPAERAPDGKPIRTVRPLRVANPLTGATLHELPPLGSPPRRYAEAHASANGRWLVTDDDVSDANLVTLWDLDTGKRAASLGESSRFVAFSPDERLVAADCWAPERADTSFVRVWDCESGRPIADFAGLFGSMYPSAFGGDSRSFTCLLVHPFRLVTFALDGDRPVAEFGSFRGEVRAAAWSSDGGSVLAWGPTQPPDGAPVIRVFDVRTRRERFHLPGRDAVFGAGGSLVAFVESASDVRGEGTVAVVVRTADGSVVARLPGAGRPLTRVAFDPAGTRLAVAASDQTVTTWDIESGRELCAAGEPAAPPSASFSVAWTPDGQRLVVSGYVGHAFDASTGRRLVDFPVSMRGGAVISPSGRLVAFTGFAAGVFDLETGAKRLDFAARSSFVDVAFSPDETRVAATGITGTVTVLDVATGRHVLDLTADAMINDLEFSPDGTKLLAAGIRGDVRIWDARDGRLLANLDCPSGRQRVHGLPPDDAPLGSFSPDGSRALVAYGDGLARIWPLDPMDAAVAACRREFTPAERLRYVQGCDELVLHAAERLVKELWSDHGMPDDLADAVRSAPEIDENVRAAALALVPVQPEIPFVLNRTAWAAVARPGADPVRLRRALRFAARAVELEPFGDELVTTLGAALYRSGDFAAAVKTLTRSSALHTEDSFDDLAFLAMAQWKLGRRDEAKRLLGEMAEFDCSEDAGAQALLREAEELVGR